jgi:predicted permease
MAPLRAPAFPYVVRVREGVTPQVAGDRISGLVRAGTAGLAPGWQVELRSTHGIYVERIRPLLLAVAIATTLVLLIACANVSVLLTVRATRRRHETAVRQALGATASQATRARVAEPLILGFTATALGLAAAWGTIAAVAPVLDHYLGRPAPGGVAALRLDMAAVGVSLLVGLLVVAISAIVPTWVARRTPVALAISTGQKGATDGPAQRRARGVLIAIEVAACLTLLVGAGLTIQSAVRMLNVEMGLDATDVVVGRFSLRQRAYPDAAARASFYGRVLARSSELTGVERLALTNAWPLQESPSRDVGVGGSSQFQVRAGMVGVSPDYFDVLRIPLHAGRFFSATDRVGAAPVALISRTLATRLWPATNAIGEQLQVAPAPNSPPTARPAYFTVVGVVGDIRHAHTDNELSDVYVALLQSPSLGVFTYLRTSRTAVAPERNLQRLLASIDADVGFAAPGPLAEILDLQRAGSRLMAYVLVVFAVFAAALALVGIYGVIAYTVKQREREIAVRMAIGADRQAITRLFVGQGALILTVGLVIGVAGALALGRVLRAQLFGVEPTDPAVIAATTLAFALCGLAAIAWPARRAAALDPSSALKE